MFSCLYKLIGIRIQHHPLKIQERSRSGLLCLLLRGKGDDGQRGVRLLFAVRVAVPSVPLSLLLLLLFSPPDPDPSCHLLEYIGEEDAKAPSPPSSSSLRKKRRRTAQRSFPLRRRCPRRHPQSPCSPPTSLPRCVCCCVARRVDCCIVAFRSFPRTPSKLLPLFRCVVGRSSAGSLASSSKRLIVMYDV